METITVTEAKATLSRLVQRALAGETIAIGRRGEPEVVLTAIVRDPTPRVLGGWEPDREYWMAEDFDAPMPDVEAAFSGGGIQPDGPDGPDGIGRADEVDGPERDVGPRS